MAKAEVKGKTPTKDIAIVGGIAALTIGGIYLMTRKVGVKKPGSTITAAITVTGRGYPGSFQVGFGLCQAVAGIWEWPGEPFKHDIKQFVSEIHPIDLTGDLSTFKFTVKGKLEDIFEEGKLDAYIFVVPEDYTIDPTNPKPSERGIGKWYDDVYTVA